MQDKAGRKGIIDAYVSAAPAGFPDGMRIRDQAEEVLDILYRRKWFILIVFVIVAAGAAVYSFTRTPIYQSSSVIMVDLGRTSLSKNEDAVSVGDNLFATNERSLAGEIFVIETSARIAERVHDRISGPQKGYVRFAPASMAVNAMSVTGVSSDPEQAALLANLYAEEYVALTKDASRTHMTSSREFLEQQEKERKAELREAEERVKEYIESTGTASMGAGSANLVGDIAAFQSQLDDARIELESRQATLASTERELETLSPQLANRIASRLDLKIAAVQSKLAELEVAKEEILLYNPNRSAADLEKTRLPQIDRQIAQLRSEIETLSSDYVDEVIATGGISSGEEGLSYVAELKRRAVEERTAINGLQARMDVLQNRLAERRRELRALPEQEVQLARLERAKQQAEEAYEYIAEQLRSKRIEEETEPGYAHILRRATEPSRPVSPDHQRNLILGGFFGILLALGGALARDKLDSRIYKPDSIRDGGREVLGVIPDMKPLVKSQFSKSAFVEQDGQTYATTLATHLSPFSTVAEAYRHLRTRIQFSIPDRVIRTILVTSAGMGEGKSTSAANLAIVMAQADRRTLLIDADLRRPQLKDMFGTGKRPTLMQLLTNAPEFELEALRTNIENLYLVTAREALEEIGDEKRLLAKNPSELLGSARMRDLLEVFRDRFDVIVIDTPPLGAATDAALLATQCDATILVTRSGQTREAELEDAHETLDNVGATVIGTLLNDFDVSQAYGQKYKYDHYSKYGIYSHYQIYNQTLNGSSKAIRGIFRRTRV